MTGDELKKQLAEKYPQIGLTFGYIGNLERWGDDRSWYFFTKVRPPQSDNCLSFGSCRTDKLDEFIAKAERELENWIVERVLPHAEHVYRSFDVVVPLHVAPIVEKTLKAHGASFGMRGGGRFSFSLQHKTLEDIREIVTGLVGTEGVTVEPSRW